MARGEGAGSVAWYLFILATLTQVVAPTWGQGTEGGPEIVYFGLIRADDTVIDASGVDEEGRPIYDRPFGFGFSLVVEAERGTADERIGENTFAEPGCPDLQVQVTRPLGNGSETVCDTVPPDDGGVPAIDPPQLDGEPTSCDPVNDLGCRFLDGKGDHLGRLCGEGCVLFPSGEYGCISPAARLQFCGLIARSAEFPIGDTLVTARVRDVEGTLGPRAQIIVRIAPPTATPSPTPTPTSPPLPTATRRRSDDDTCAILPPGHGHPGRTLALLLVPGLLLLARKRGLVARRKGTNA